MAISDDLVPHIFRRKVEKTQPKGENMDGKVFITRQDNNCSLCS